MTLFIVICIALTVLAIFMLALPLLTPQPQSPLGMSAANAVNATNVSIYKDQFKELEADLRAGTLTAEHYDKARGELEARMLEDLGSESAPAIATAATVAAVPSARNGRRAAYALLIALPLCAVAVYAIVGTPGALSSQPGVAKSASAPHGTDASQIESMVGSLAARLKEDPTNGQGWMMLGRSYSSLGRFGEAAEAYKKSVANSPPDAQLLADYADALAMALGRQLVGEPEKLVARALEIDGKNMKALALAGTIAFEKRDYSGAVKYWSRMRALVPPDSDDARAIDANIAEASSMGGVGSAGSKDGGAAQQSAMPMAKGAAPDAKAATTSTPPSAAVGASAGVGGMVKLAPELAAKASPTDTVFIFARAANGPPMPLAVLRKQVRDLPVTFTLDDTMAMMPAMKLSDFPQVVVGARISKSANATPQPGDLQGITAAVGNNARDITVVISTEVR